jgi:demethylmenaquinone methyltransferase/2-methoxy-6-polyprenyl-1,4-benzoquinol methylase
VLQPGGRAAFLEVATPSQPWLRLGHRVWFGGVVPIVGGLLSDAAAYRYLPRSVVYLPDPPALAGMLAGAGFVDVRRHLLSGGIAQLVVAERGR